MGLNGPCAQATGGCNVAARARICRQAVRKCERALTTRRASRVASVRRQVRRHAPDDWPCSSYHEWKKEFGRPINVPPEDWKPVHLGER